MSASAYSLTAMIPAEAFRVVTGELERGGIKDPAMTAEKLAWVKTPAIHSYKGFPSVEDLRCLVKEFAAYRTTQEAAKGAGAGAAR